MRIAVLADGDAMDVRTWSGVPYYMVKALRSEFSDLVVLDAPKSGLANRVRWWVCDATRGRIRLEWTYSGAQWAAQPVLRRLKAIKPDAVICIGNSPLGAFVARQHPTVHISDTTFKLISEYYDDFRKIAGPIKISGDNLERMVIRHAAACLFSSNWAADSAVADYGADRSRVHVIPWGCNNDVTQAPPIPMQVDRTTCHLVFAAMDWIRKGGDIAVETTRLLAESGMNVHLHVVGPMPESRHPAPYITYHGAISKATPEGEAAFNGLLEQASFLLAPTRADCTPMAFAEANFYGVPVLSTDTGGVASVVQQGVNGAILPLSADAANYAELVRTIWLDKKGYETLRRRSRQRFETVLNWQAWAHQTGQIVRGLLARAERQVKVGGPGYGGLEEGPSNGLGLNGPIMARRMDHSIAASTQHPIPPRA